MNNQERLKKFKDKLTFNKRRESNILDSWHYLMIHYGWIPFEEFKKIDDYLVNELIKRLNELNRQYGGRFRR